MIEVLEKQYRITNTMVNHRRHLRTGDLFRMLQECAAEHSEALGVGIEQTDPLGVAWVLLLQRAEILRMPSYRENVTIRTWPGREAHGMYPRYYCVLDAEGKVLVNASSLWGIWDVKSRKLLSAEKSGVIVPEIKTGAEIVLPRVPRRFETTDSASFTVPYSYVDMNDHMNNTRYFDLAEDMLPAPALVQDPCLVLTEYTNEARMGEVIELNWGKKDGQWVITGSGERPIFRMVLEYRE